jgi:NTP pyrophosphatase (non-canonical NTP hydrolase)
MKYSQEAVRRMQLEEYVAVVPKIYSKHDQHRSIWDVWCHTLHHGAAVAERIRKKAPPDELFKEIADFALWLFTSVHKLSGRPGKRKMLGEAPVETVIRIESGCSDLLWHRYPGVCHLCYARRLRSHGRPARGVDLLDPCDCSQHEPDFRDKNTKRVDSRELRKFSESHSSRKPHTIDDWQGMFATIFRANLEQLSLPDISLHLMEELGEVSDALVRTYSYAKKDFRAGEPNWRQARLEGQIADVFSWLYALVEKLNEMSQDELGTKLGSIEAKSRVSKRVTLSEIIWKRYGSDRLHAFHCSVCGKPVCGCPLVFVPATRPLKELLGKFQRPSRRRAK